MLFVLYGHLCPEWNEYFVFTSPIKIPLFFAITGYVFNDRSGNTQAFFSNLFWKLCIPWIVLSLLPLKLIKALVIDRSVVLMGQYVVDFLSGNTLWYMPCCIIAEIITFTIRKSMRDKVIGVTIASLLISLVGYCIAMCGDLGFAGIDTALIVQLYILVGYFFKKYENEFKEKSVIVCSITAIIYVCLGLLTLTRYPGQTIDVHTNTYYDLLVCALMIMCGCIFLFTVASSIDAKVRVFAYIGKNTLVFYMLNSYVFKLINEFLTLLGVTELRGPLYWLMLTALASLICWVIAEIINTAFPEIVGKKRKVR